ncbi:anhydro-N-acetylmuramic acid kinase [Asticcacaulis biprosthecium C19]|uniref:Anhydro-N-acetylmuramic acid kinase n=1 Tax=Asticcacaulis biprosthecium C19 TaxID=715226 RepID=F4QQB5_9CAUL|nr:anhydro-N-acetylmuramic acid kinase [Asticcacaulis biprosthecium]EGF90402.1 anhydro-N-acetylmuramic acid kinase [Asticcacaulis biprosthecium C19]
MKVLGFMTGTSLDGIDLAILDSDGESIAAFGPWAENAMPPAVRGILENAVRTALAWPRGAAEPAVFEEARRVLVGFHLEAADHFLRHNGLSFKDIDLMGVHGQTVLHERPQPGRKGRTVQLFDGQAFADATGVTVVSDFRQADVAAGGEGAPLAPVYHRALVQQAGLGLPVVVVNLGGVANITLIDEDLNLTALDTGPANGLMDQWMRQHGRGDYDHEGQLAASGAVDADVVAAYLGHPYFAASAPKSLDRYDFTLERVQGMPIEDGMATLSAFTLQSLMAGIDQVGAKPKTVVLAGGGRHNAHLVRGIASALSPARVVLAEDLGWRGGAVEAEAFAYMAARSLRGLPISFPGTTSAPEPLTGGVISSPRGRSQSVA